MRPRRTVIVTMRAGADATISFVKGPAPESSRPTQPEGGLVLLVHSIDKEGLDDAVDTEDIEMIVVAVRVRVDRRRRRSLGQCRRGVETALGVGARADGREVTAFGALDQAKGDENAKGAVKGGNSTTRDRRAHWSGLVEGREPWKDSAFVGLAYEE